MRRWRFGEPTAALAEVVRRGGILAVPTESSYGLAADPLDAVGVQTVYAAKGRGPEKALPVVIADVEQLEALGADADGPAIAPFAPLWPAALSVVVPLRRPIAAAPAGRLAVRIPAHRGLRRLLHELGPLTATSANRSGGEPALAPRDLEPLLAGVDAVVVDDGPLPGGAPSTLVEWRAGRVAVLREGRFPVAALRRRFSAATVEIAAENPSRRPVSPRSAGNA